MAESTCTKASSAMTAVYDRDVHSVATHHTLKVSMPLGTCAAEERSELNPIDLMAMGLASCLLIVMGKVAVKEKLDMLGATADVSYALDGYRIKSFAIQVNLPKKLSVADQAKLEAASKECPLYLAIGPDVAVTVNFKWPA